MGQLLTTRFDNNEAAMAEDVQHVEDREIANLETILGELVNSTSDVIVRGGLVQQRSSPSMNVDISTLLAFCQNTGNISQVGSLFGPLSVDEGDLTARIDLVEIRQKKTAYDSQPRNFRDPSTGNVTTVDTNTKYVYSFEAQVIKGTPGSGIAPNHTVGWIKIAEIHVDANESTAIYTADIFNVTAGRDGEETTLWTAEKAATYRLNSLAFLKTLFRTQHKEDGDHVAAFAKAAHIDFGTGSGQVEADVVQLGTDVTNTPTGGTSTSLIAASFVRAALQEIFNRLKDLSGVSNLAVLNRHLAVAR